MTDFADIDSAQRSGAPSIDEALSVAREAVAAASAAALQHFRPEGIAARRKADRSPVTAADLAAEAAILAILRKAYPAHGVLAEESGVLPGSTETRWIVDPLDGTRGFSRGGAFWGPLLALQHRGEIIVGVMALPARGETYYAARGRGAYRDGQRLAVSRLDDVEDATLSVGELRSLLGPPHGEGVAALIRGMAVTRGYGDLAGCAMLVDGRAEAWLEAGVRIWDLAPHKILVEEAGGRFTDFAGGDDLEGGCAVASNGLIHDALLARLRGV